MINTHELCVVPESNDVVIWRYMDLAKFVSMLSRCALWFSRSDLMGDDFEGSYSAPTLEQRRKQAIAAGEQFNLTENAVREMADGMQVRAMTYWWRRFVFVNCWTREAPESVALWQQYSGGSLGIAVKSTYGRFVGAIQTELEVFPTCVKYIDYAKESMPDWNLLSPYLHKRHGYRHENEFRGIILRGPQGSGNMAEVAQQSPPGLSIPVNLELLVEQIRVGPAAPSWFVETVEAVVQRFGLMRTVDRSELDAQPTY